ncbi:MAG: acyl-ACP--UDP-N-acetylglucosamine O-acyltransferase [candidate division WOR-3 bacterium]
MSAKSKISSLAIIDKSVEIEEEVKIFPYAIVEKNSFIGRKTIIYPFAVIGEGTIIGPENKIYQGVIIGMPPLDLKYKGEKSRVVIGRGNVIREYTTIHRATGKGKETKIGDHNFIMAYCHISHNCQIGNHNIITNFAQIAGHCQIFDFVNIGGMAGIHQHVRIGSYAFVGACSYLKKDLLPFMIGEGNPFRVRGVNITGLKRNHFPKEKIALLKKIYRLIFRSRLNLSDALKEIKKFPPSPEINLLLDFIVQSRRGIELKTD